MTKIKINFILPLLIALSMLCYAIRGKMGAILITLYSLILLIYLIKHMKIRKSFGFLFALFILIFVMIIGIIRTKNFRYYLFIGYFASILVLLNNKLDIYRNIWNILGKISLFEAIGIFVQKLFPNIYYSLFSIFLPSYVVSSIKSRLVGGYYTGFTREISYTMFFIIIGLGIYIFDILKTDKNNDISNYKIKKYFKITFLFAALFISGKRATLIFFVLSIFTVNFIKSKESLKIFKYAIYVFLLLFFLYITFPIWSKINAISRLVELFSYIDSKNIIGLTNGRIFIYRNAIDLWKTNRLFGIGWGNFKYMVDSSLWYSGYDVHNCYLQILCENGLIGAIIFYSLTLISIVRFIKCLKIARDFGNNYYYKMALISAYIQIFFIIYSITEPILYEYTDYIIYFIAINITSILLYKMRKNKKIIA